MGLTKAQASIWQKARSLSGSQQAVALTDEMCTYLVVRIAADLGVLDRFHEVISEPLEFFGSGPSCSLAISGHDCKSLFERLVTINRDGDVYFACLAALQKARLKYERILSTQPIPAFEQVGPRGLLQYGKLKDKALAAFLFWRKWFFDIDNRACQETGLLFEPIIAYAVGGTPCPARRSPVKRAVDSSKGRQVDCLVDDRAYEFKIRVTIAASGQGRWQEELDFPLDCRKSGYTPVLVCMDGTLNPKLDALVKAFRQQNGEVYVGEEAWRHLDAMAGETMSVFLDKYVRKPIQDLSDRVEEHLPELVAQWSPGAIRIEVGEDSFEIQREPCDLVVENEDKLPDDAAEGIPGL